ncbi:MAG: ABC transporter substrate-binding protein [Deltaproteobacteria bacterium]|nr:ABC transporter substrate-binding protein [Deltaproteobacteria bacterium]
MRRARQFALCWLLLAAGAVPATARAGGVAVVADNALNVYRRVITGFTVEVRRQVVEFSLGGKRERGKEVFAAALSAKPDLLLAIGPISASLARELMPKEIPVVFCMVPNLEQYPDLKGPNITGVALELSLRDQLATLKTVAPKTQSVGVVFNPKHTAKKIEEARVAAGELGLKLVTAEAATPGDVARAVSSLERRIDALWMVPDKTVLDLDAFKALLEFSLKKKIPFFSLNSKFVEKGALVSLGIDYMRIGQQAGQLAKRILDEKVQPSSIAVRSPEGLEIAINLTTAREIGVQCDLALEVFTFAAEKRFAINVYK